MVFWRPSWPVFLPFISLTASAHFPPDCVANKSHSQPRRLQHGIRTRLFWSQGQSHSPAAGKASQCKQVCGVQDEQAGPSCAKFIVPEWKDKVIQEQCIIVIGLLDSQDLVQRQRLAPLRFSSREWGRGSSLDECKACCFSTPSDRGPISSQDPKSSSRSPPR